MFEMSKKAFLHSLQYQTLEAARCTDSSLEPMLDCGACGSVIHAYEAGMASWATLVAAQEGSRPTVDVLQSLESASERLASRVSGRQCLCFDGESEPSCGLDKKLFVDVSSMRNVCSGQREILSKLCRHQPLS